MIKTNLPQLCLVCTTYAYAYGNTHSHAFHLQSRGMRFVYKGISNQRFNRDFVNLFATRQNSHRELDAIGNNIGNYYAKWFCTLNVSLVLVWSPNFGHCIWSLANILKSSVTVETCHWNIHFQFANSTQFRQKIFIQTWNESIACQSNEPNFIC